MARTKINRKKSKRRLTMPLMLVMVILLAVMTSASISAFEWLRDSLLNSRLFVLEGISVHGNRRVSSAEILNASNLNVGIDNIYSIMYNTVERHIRVRFRYLKEVKIQRKFAFDPGAGVRCLMDIMVKERDPVAFVRLSGDDGAIVVDDRGFILEWLEAGSDVRPMSPYGNMPVIVGVDGESITSDGLRIMDCPALDLAVDVLTTARSAIPELFGEISCIDARDQDNIILLLQEQQAARGEGADRSSLVVIASDCIENGLSNVLPVIIKRRAENKEAEYIDARFPEAVYCGDQSIFHIL